MLFFRQTFFSGDFFARLRGESRFPRLAGFTKSPYVNAKELRLRLVGRGSLLEILASIMNKSFFPQAMAFVFLLAASSVQAANKIKVLIADGPQKAHKHQDTTHVLQKILEKVALFKVEHARS